MLDHVDRGLGRSAACVLLALAALLVVPSVASAAADLTSAAGQLRQSVAQTLNGTVAGGTGQVAQTLDQATVPVRQTVAATPVEDVGRRLPETVAGGARAADTAVQQIVPVERVEASASAAVDDGLVAASAPTAGRLSDAAGSRRGRGERVTVRAHASSRRGVNRSAAAPSAVAPAADRQPTGASAIPAAASATHADRPNSAPARDDKSRLPAPTPSGSASGAPGGIVLPTGLAVLAAAIGLGASGWRQRRCLAGDRWRPLPFVSVLERPG